MLPSQPRGSRPGKQSSFGSFGSFSFRNSALRLRGLAAVAWRNITFWKRQRGHSALSTDGMDLSFSRKLLVVRGAKTGGFFRLWAKPCCQRSLFWARFRSFWVSGFLDVQRKNRPPLMLLMLAWACRLMLLMLVVCC